MGKRSLQNSMLATLHQLCKDHGVELAEFAQGHFQIRGQLLVNYYPFSSKRTAYVAGTKGGKHDVDPLQAVRMAITAPKIVPKHDRVRRQVKAAREHRRQLLAKGVTTCCWCNCDLNLNTSTLEHIIPLARGGLDQRNNMTLACKPCNEKRGHDMPELDVQLIAKPPAHLEPPVILPVVEKPALLIAKPETEPEKAPFDWRDISHLPVIEQKLILDLKAAELSAITMRADKDLGRVGRIEKERRKDIMDARTEAAAVLQIVRAHQKRVNHALSVQSKEVYDARFSAVAKQLLPAKVYAQLVKECKRQNPNLYVV